MLPNGVLEDDGQGGHHLRLAGSHIKRQFEFVKTSG
jgi:hypothetical protein